MGEDLTGGLVTFTSIAIVIRRLLRGLFTYAY